MTAPKKLKLTLRQPQQQQLSKSSSNSSTVIIKDKRNPPRQNPSLTSQYNNPSARSETTDISVSVQTAESIASNPHHPRSAEILDLLRTFERGWISNDKFKQILAELVL